MAIEDKEDHFLPRNHRGEPTKFIPDRPRVSIDWLQHHMLRRSGKRFRTASSERVQLDGLRILFALPGFFSLRALSR